LKPSQTALTQLVEVSTFFHWNHKTKIDTPVGARWTTGSNVIGPSEKSSLRAVVIVHIKKDFPVPALPSTLSRKVSG